VIGVAFGLDTGEVSPVMAAESAAYVLRVTNRNDVGEIPESERQQIRQQLLARERQQVAQQFIASLRNDAEITDNRSKLLN
jgi:peptidylprolyl isomerase/peptidyl-prolyl cis-trans isomerase D